MKSIQLTREIGIEKYQTKAQIAQAEERIFFQAIIEFIMEKAEDGINDKRTLRDGIALHLLFRPNLPLFADRLLTRLQELGCISINGNEVQVTQIGHQLRERGKITVPREDIFEIQCILNEPVLGSTVIDMVAVEISKDNENGLVETVLRFKEQVSEKQKENREKGKTGGSKSKIMKNLTKKLVKLPSSLRSLIGEDYELLSQKKFHLKYIDENGLNVTENKKARLTLELFVDGKRRLQVFVKDKSIDRTGNLDKNTEIDRTIALNYQMVKNVLIKQLGYVYDRNIDTVLLDKNQLIQLLGYDYRLLHNFSTDFVVDDPSLKINGEDYGVFRSTKLEGVKLLPYDNECASQWARYLLFEKIDHYLTKEEYLGYLNDIVNIAQFNGFTLTLPSWDQAIRDPMVKFGSPIYWYLITKRDLSMEVIA
ncbi:MAG: hypothetical protein INQ03_00435 [Candidatus Heimdallarchaeota archaeon]|nr:hypothetical protein [Candidatus Heimdallarchaeota archaeon]